MKEQSAFSVKQKWQTILGSLKWMLKNMGSMEIKRSAQLDFAKRRHMDSLRYARAEDEGNFEAK